MASLSAKLVTATPRGRLSVNRARHVCLWKLVLREDGVKITISLSKRSVEFFKAHAAASTVPYRQMTRVRRQVRRSPRDLLLLERTECLTTDTLGYE
jgi:hypothetical protein